MKLHDIERLRYLLLLSVIVISFPNFTLAQSRSIKTMVTAHDVLTTIELGIQRDNIDLVKGNIYQQLSLSVPGTDAGVYSTNQAISILHNYFEDCHIIAFKFTTVSYDGETPYATGGGTYISHGKKVSFQVYVALRRVHEQWVISQFNIY